MKITKSRLKQIIKEELKTILEVDTDNDGIEDKKELAIIDKGELDTKDESMPEIPELKNIKIHSSGEHAVMAVPGLRGRSKEDVKDYLMDFGIFPDKIGDGVVAFVRKKRYLSSFRDFFEELQEYDESWSEHLDTGRSYDLDRDEPGEQYPLLEKNMKITKDVLKQIIKEELEALDENPVLRNPTGKGSAELAGRPANDNVARDLQNDILESILKRLAAVERRLDNLTRSGPQNY